MIAPQPFKYKFMKCNYSEIVKPKSDILNPIDFINTCPKCIMYNVLLCQDHLIKHSYFTHYATNRNS